MALEPGLWPRHVTYRERLTPDAAPVDVELPATRDDVFDLLATLARLATSDPAAWKSLYRQYAVCDWYVLAFLLSGAQRMDPFTGRPELDCDFQFNWAREMQFDGDNVLDKSAREHGKTTWRGYVGLIAELLRDPELTAGIFAFERAAAARSGARVKDELASNVELRAAFDDTLWADPEREAPLWSMEKGLVLRRRIVSGSPSLGWYSILDLPTGSRLGLGLLDDVETEITAATEDMRRKTMARIQNAFNLAGRACRWWVNGTHHHPQGAIAEMEKSGGWRVRCHKAEDEEAPAPDIAALYDECHGALPLRDGSGRTIPLPPEVRNVRLAGAPVYLHPLECAMKRLRQGNETYTRQNQGDPLAGQERRLAVEWIKWYKAPPVEWARGANLYIVIDPSKGVGDPTFARVEACKEDGTIAWVGGLRRRLTPSQFAPAIFHLAMEWAAIGTLIEIRVEEFAQSTWSYHLRTYFDSRNQHVAPIIACTRHNKMNRESSGRQREWAGLEPMYRAGRRVYPEGGIRVFDENNPLGYDLVDYYVQREYKDFPLPITDDGLAADYLLAVTKGKDERGHEINLTLQFPTDEALSWQRELSELREARHAGADSASWMSDWCM